MSQRGGWSRSAWRLHTYTRCDCAKSADVCTHRWRDGEEEIGGTCYLLSDAHSLAGDYSFVGLLAVCVLCVVCVHSVRLRGKDGGEGGGVCVCAQSSCGSAEVYVTRGCVCV